MKRRLYPKSIKVGKHRYKVEMSPKIEDSRAKKGEVTRGFCDVGNKLIVLWSKQSEADLFSTFIHELLHAVEYEHKLRISHKLIYAMEGPLSEALRNTFHIIPRR